MSKSASLFKPTTSFLALRDKGTAPRQSSKSKLSELGVINTPICTYFTHELRTWLEWLLGLKNIECEITQWKAKVQNNTNVIDIQQSLAWRSFTWSNPKENDIDPLQLAFLLFVDWFNPCGSKLSGKQQSMGCIVLSCLNLPPDLRNKPGYSLLYIIIPGPNAPNTTTISIVLRPLVDELLILKDGVKICTSDYPKGCEIYVQLLSSVGDLVAMHKIVGFGSHSASQFCAWCTAELKDLQAMSIGTHRGAHEVREAANTWKSATSISLQEKI
ncbi:hypothetical protein O181_090770 [Austropuccinia psidii MF-1]|uniref:Uncharacterized protein n=1 Tax=Austropuccinia psidii MF-1 TaxID=1389203 RepID=A0A9Q3IVM1_9BASI|nr:hypothetical protein [Austropuccinia psidii MF-1]